MHRGADHSSSSIEVGSHHPTEFSVGVNALAEQLAPALQDEIACYFLVSVMKFVFREPNICAST